MSATPFPKTPDKRSVLLLCFKRKIYLFSLFLFILFTPLALHADWSWSLPFSSAEPPPSVSTSRGKTAVAGPTEPGPGKSLKPAVPALAVKSQQAATALPSLPEASVTVTGPQPFTPAPTRAIAPFAPVLKFGSRVIKEDTVWSGAVQVDGMVTVAVQATLSISPGTVIRFSSNSGILVLGRIAAKGSAENPVLLTSLYVEPHASDWYGIVLTGTGKKNIFENIIINGAETAIYVRYSSIEAKKIRLESSSTAIRMIDSIGSLKEASISDCSTGFSAVKSEVELESVALEKGKLGITVLSSAVTAAELKISAFTQAALVADKSQLKLAAGLFAANLTGARVSGCEGSIINSRFIDNIETGVVLSGSCLQFSANLVTGSRVGLQLEDDLPAVFGNSVHGNSSYNLLYLGDEKIYLGGNWLGQTNGTLMDKSLFSRRPEAAMILPLLASDPLSASKDNL